MPLTSRYLTQSDEAKQHFVFPLPPEWWSRPYEYAWASHFAGPDDVVLDAGCGLGHPFKFFLGGRCREVHALDSDPGIMHLDIDSIAKEFGTVAGTDTVEDFGKIHFACADIAEMPYPDAMFDKVFCISVIEHLDITSVVPTLREFARTIKPDGLIVITFDYPVINLSSLEQAANNAGMGFAGGVVDMLPDDAISGYGFHCGRAVLRKKV